MKEMKMRLIMLSQALNIVELSMTNGGSYFIELL